MERRWRNFSQTWRPVNQHTKNSQNQNFTCDSNKKGYERRCMNERSRNNFPKYTRSNECFHQCQQQKVYKRYVHELRQHSFSIYVDNIPFEMEHVWLCELFKQQGDVVDVFIPKKWRYTRKSKYGFVRFSTFEQAQSAIRNMNGIRVSGSHIVLKPTKDMKSMRVWRIKKHTPTNGADEHSGMEEPSDTRPRTKEHTSPIRSIQPSLHENEDSLCYSSKLPENQRKSHQSETRLGQFDDATVTSENGSLNKAYMSHGSSIHNPPVEIDDKLHPTNVPKSALEDGITTLPVREPRPGRRQVELEIHKIQTRHQPPPHQDKLCKCVPPIQSANQETSFSYVPTTYELPKENIRKSTEKNNKRKGFTEHEISTAPQYQINPFSFTISQKLKAAKLSRAQSVKAASYFTSSDLQTTSLPPISVPWQQTDITSSLPSSDQIQMQEQSVIASSPKLTQPPSLRGKQNPNLVGLGKRPISLLCQPLPAQLARTPGDVRPLPVSRQAEHAKIYRSSRFSLKRKAAELLISCNKELSVTQLKRQRTPADFQISTPLIKRIQSSPKYPTAASAQPPTGIYE